MNYYVGIDLGGTNVRIAKVDDDGRIVQDVIAPSHGLEGPEKIEENILDLLKQFDLTDVKSIGLAIPGPVDGERNVITQATNIPGCEGYPFAANMQQETGIPVFLDNDANAAGLAEQCLALRLSENALRDIDRTVDLAPKSEIVAGVVLKPLEAFLLCHRFQLFDGVLILFQRVAAQ